MAVDIYLRKKAVVGTLIVGILLAAVVVWAVMKLVRDRRNGKGTCGCSGNCAGCAGGCASAAKKKELNK